MTTATAYPAETTLLYDRFQERVLERDQVGASGVFYDLVRAGRPLNEMLAETIRIHAPYTHVPYHQRIDGGVVRFVNNDHCLLSGRAALQLGRFVPPEFSLAPMAQTVWYVPTGLDPWNQLLGRMPGHYARTRFDRSQYADLPSPEIHWADQEPLVLEGSIDERLDHWLTLVQRGEVLQAYRVFLGIVEQPEHRERALAHLVFAGLIDVQDRMIYNRSYTTGHKSYRARATVELIDAVGWERAHPVLYAGVPDVAVGPRWHSNYEMAGEVAWIVLAEEAERQKSSIAASPDLPPERRLLANEAPLTVAEQDMLLYALIRAPEPAYIEAISALLLAGKSARSIVDVLQVAASQLLLETGDPRNFSMTQHCAQYQDNLGWFYDRFDHQHRIKLLYVGGSFIAQAANWLRSTPGNAEANTVPTKAQTDLSRRAILEHLDEAMVARDPVQSIALVRAYEAGGYGRRPLVETLALGAAKHGNDTHNQEIGLVLVDSFGHNAAGKRDLLLRACAQHNAGHIKYGDSLEPFRRFTEAMGIENRQRSEGDADPTEALLDD